MNENLPIDPSMLDEEWLQQPLLFDQAQQAAADALEKRDNLKTQLTWLEADRASYIRKAFKEEGLDKAPTQAVVDDWVTKCVEVQVAREELTAAYIESARANNLVESFQMRKRALEKLTDLHISNYFSVPNPGHLVDGGKRFLQEKEKRVEEKAIEATDKLNERKRARSGKTKEEVLDKIKNPETKEAARKAIEAEESKEQAETSTPRRRRRKEC